MEIKLPQGKPDFLGSELETLLEKKMREFIDSRRVYDHLMEQFMNALLEKSKQSPELLKAIGEIGAGLKDKRSQIQPPEACHN